MFRFNLVGAELAERTGLTPTQISDFRNGKINPRIDTIERIMGVLTREQKEYFLLLVAQDTEAGHVPLPGSTEEKQP